MNWLVRCLSFSLLVSVFTNATAVAQIKKNYNSRSEESAASPTPTPTPSPSPIQSGFYAKLHSFFGGKARAARPSALPQPRAITTYTWTGNGLTNGWIDDGNWDIPPDPNGILNFEGSNNTTNVNNRFNTLFEIRFNSTSAFTLSGNPLSFPTYNPPPEQIRNDNTGTGTVNIDLTFTESVARDAEFDAVGGDLVIGGTVTIVNNGTGLAFYGDGHSVTFNGSISGVGKNLNIFGTNTVTLNANNTLSGAVAVNAEPLTRTSRARSAERLPSVSVAAGTLLLSGNGNLNRVNDSATISLNGGTIRKGPGASEGTSSSMGLGALTLSANSTIDYTNSAGTLTFASFVPGGSVLSIVNYLISGSPGGLDQLIFHQDQSSHLGNFDFGFGPGTFVTEAALGGGYYEVYPVVPVPEMATWTTGMLAAAGIFATGKMRRRSRAFRAR